MQREANSRIKELDLNKKTVMFSYKDYADQNKIKDMTLATDEFIRRFLLHVVPGGLFANTALRVFKL